MLVPARPAAAAEVPDGARRLAVAVAAAPDRQPPLLTYALAESAGALVHSLCVRIVDGAGRRLGYAMWINSQARGGVWWPTSRRVQLDELTALATGAPYVPRPAAQPAPTGPCPRCGREVRWTNAGVPYRHQRAAPRGEGGQTAKEICQ